jgi:hypothetical protein
MTDCDRFAELLNAVLDGDAPASALGDGHCDACRRLAAAARLMARVTPSMRPVPPPRLGDRLVAELTRRRRRRWPTAVALGASLAAVWFAIPDRRPAPRPLADHWRPVAAAAASAAEPLADAARLVPTPSLSLPDADLGPDLTRVTAPLGRAAKAGAEPLTGTARRAFDLFRRDLGLDRRPARPS